LALRPCGTGIAKEYYNEKRQDCSCFHVIC
jgi:hypothetical protein